MESVHNLGNSMTIIIIAHRVTTLKNCDKIFLLQNGEILEQGNYETLMKSIDDFENKISKKN